MTWKQHNTLKIISENEGKTWTELSELLHITDPTYILRTLIKQDKIINIDLHYYTKEVGIKKITI